MIITGQVLKISTFRSSNFPYSHQLHSKLDFRACISIEATKHASEKNSRKSKFVLHFFFVIQKETFIKPVTVINILSLVLNSIGFFSRGTSLNDMLNILNMRKIFKAQSVLVWCQVIQIDINDTRYAFFLCPLRFQLQINLRKKCPTTTRKISLENNQMEKSEKECKF